MLENFNEDRRKNSMTQFSDFHTGWSITREFIRHQTTSKILPLSVFEWFLFFVLFAI